MSLPFAFVAIQMSEERFIPGTATVPGLGEVEAPTRDAFCEAAGNLIFKGHPEISEVRFVGPRKEETSVRREKLVI